MDGALWIAQIIGQDGLAGDKLLVGGSDSFFGGADKALGGFAEAVDLDMPGHDQGRSLGDKESIIEIDALVGERFELDQESRGMDDDAAG